MEVKVYTTPSCIQCEMTKKQLNRFGIKYSLIDLGATPEAKAEIDPLGYTSAPVVVAGDLSWSGFRLSSIQTLAHIIFGERKAS